MTHSKKWLPSLLCCALSLATAQAASPSVWNGGGADNLWSNPDNWGGNPPVPGSTYDLQFGGATRLLPQNDLGNPSLFRNITFNADAGAFRLRGNNLDLYGSILNNSATHQTLSNRVLVATGGAVSIDGDMVLAGSLTNVGVLTINSGNVTSLNNFVTARLNGESGAVNIKGGYYENRAAWGFNSFAVGQHGYGALNISGGNVNTHGFMLGSGNSTTGIGVGTIANATVRVDDNVALPYYDGTAVLTIAEGGLLERFGNEAKAINLNQGGGASSVLNLLGGTIAHRSARIRFGGGTGASGAGVGVLNLNAGSVTLGSFDPVIGNNFINLNGGTLRPFATLGTDFLPNGAVTVYVNGPFGTYSGGAVIDTDGTINSIAPGLLAPAGMGVGSIPVADPGVGYIGAPYVSIVDGTGVGVGATAIAHMVDDGSGNGTLKVDRIEVTNPGINYQEGNVSCVLLGGGTATPATAGTVTLAANTSGGLTKNGEGTLILKGASTYTGATVINAGSLIVNGSTANTTVSVQSGAVLGGTGTAGGSVTLASGGLLSPGDPALAAAGTLTISGNLSVSGPNTMAFEFYDFGATDKIVVNGNLNISGTTTLQIPGSSTAANGDYTLMEVYGTLGGAPANYTVADPEPSKAYEIIYQSGTPNRVVLRISPPSGLLTWAGGTGVWDINGAMNWLTVGLAPAMFQNGRPVLFNDYGASVPNVNITANVAPIQIEVNTFADYTFSGAGSIAGNGSIVKAGSGALTLATANTFSGGVSLSSGTLNLNNASALGTGALTINGGALGNTSGSPVTLGSNPQTWAGDFTFNDGNLNLGSGPVTLEAPRAVSVTAGTLTAANLSGMGAITKSGAGSLVIAGDNAYTGGTTNTAGNLVIAGSLTNTSSITVFGGGATISGPVDSGSGAYFVESMERAVLNIEEGASVIKSGNFVIGRSVGSAGAVNVRGGNFTSTAGWSFNNFAIGDKGYGIVNMTGGTVESRGFILNGQEANQTGIGMAFISGGTWGVDANVMVPYFGGVGVLTVDGGTLRRLSGTASIAVNSRSYAKGEVNLLSGEIDNTGAPMYIGNTLQTGADPTGIAVVNFNGGIYTGAFISNYLGTAVLNFNGGTVRPSTSRNQFMGLNLSNPAKLYVNGAFGTFAGGAVFDTAGFDIGLPGDLLAPTGQGIASIAVTHGGSGYIGAPYVSIIDGGVTGYGATAIAVMEDDGTGNGTLRVASIRITNPGVDYTQPEYVVSTLTGGAPTVPATLGSLTLTPNTSGGLTKLGQGTLTLGGVNSYTGATLVNEGTLTVDGSLALQSAVTVAGGALAGNGFINGPVSVQTGATLAPGNGIGTLSINNNLTLSADSATLVDIDLLAGTRDMVVANNVHYAGTLVVTNHTGAFETGQSFQLFSAGAFTGNFAQVSITGATGSFDPATGTLLITGTVAQDPTDISFALSQNQLSLSWPATHIGWIAQSNAVDVANSDGWFDIPGSESQTSLNIQVDSSASKVFYRLRRP